MEITISQETLSTLLSRAQSVVERKSTRAILENVLLEAEGSKVRVSATDLRISLVQECPCGVRRAGAAAIPGRKFHEVVREMRKGESQWIIGSIQHKLLVFDLAPTSSGSLTNFRAYSTEGTSPETVTTYKRETIKLGIPTSSSTCEHVIQDSGTISSYITFSGGWNTSSDTQDGETFWDTQNGYGYLINASSARNFIILEHIHPVRCYQGFVFTNACNCVEISNMFTSSMYNIAIDFGTSNKFYIHDCFWVNHEQSCMVAAGYNHRIEDIQMRNSGSNGVYMGTGYNVMFKRIIIRNHALTGIANSGSGTLHAHWYDCEFEGGSTNLIEGSQGHEMVFSNCEYVNSTVYGGTFYYRDNKTFSHKHDQGADSALDHVIYTEGATISSEETDRHTASGYA